MSKVLSALMVILGLSLFGAPAANAFVSTSEATISTDGDGKGKKKKHHHKKHGKKHKKHGKKKKDNK